MLWQRPGTLHARDHRIALMPMYDPANPKRGTIRRGLLTFGWIAFGWIVFTLLIAALSSPRP